VGRWVTRKHRGWRVRRRLERMHTSTESRF
jgi:hypothetical protein